MIDQYYQHIYQNEPKGFNVAVVDIMGQIYKFLPREMTINSMSGWEKLAERMMMTYFDSILDAENQASVLLVLCADQYWIKSELREEVAKSRIPKVSRQDPEVTKWINTFPKPWDTTKFENVGSLLQEDRRFKRHVLFPSLLQAFKNLMSRHRDIGLGLILCGFSEQPGEDFVYLNPEVSKALELKNLPHWANLDSAEADFNTVAFAFGLAANRKLSDYPLKIMLISSDGDLHLIAPLTLKHLVEKDEKLLNIGDIVWICRLGYGEKIPNRHYNLRKAYLRLHFQQEMKDQISSEKFIDPLANLSFYEKFLVFMSMGNDYVKKLPYYQAKHFQDLLLNLKKRMKPNSMDLVSQNSHGLTIPKGILLQRQMSLNPSTQKFGPEDFEIYLLSLEFTINYFSKEAIISS